MSIHLRNIFFEDHAEDSVKALIVKVKAWAEKAGSHRFDQFHSFISDILKKPFYTAGLTYPCFLFFACAEILLRAKSAEFASERWLTVIERLLRDLHQVEIRGKHFETILKVNFHNCVRLVQNLAAGPVNCKSLYKFQYIEKLKQSKRFEDHVVATWESIVSNRTDAQHQAQESDVAVEVTTKVLSALVIVIIIRNIRYIADSRAQPPQSAF